MGHKTEARSFEEFVRIMRSLNEGTQIKIYIHYRGKRSSNMPGWSGKFKKIKINNILEVEFEGGHSGVLLGDDPKSFSELYEKIIVEIE